VLMITTSCLLLGDRMLRRGPAGEGAGPQPIRSGAMGSFGLGDEVRRLDFFGVSYRFCPSVLFSDELTEGFP